MSNRILMAAAAVAMTAAPHAAQASTFVFNFSGSGVNGQLALTYEIDTNTADMLNDIPNSKDPTGSFIITNVSGTFSDAALKLTDAKITQIEPLNQVDPEMTNHLAPSRFSLLPVLHGVDNGDIKSAGLHYDNIFYPSGSPKTASDYPFFGGIFDIYGLVFQIDTGDVVNIWSNGATPAGGPPYGVAVTDRIDLTDYVGGVSIAAVPEPASWALMIGGFGMTGAMLRRQRKARAMVRFG